MRTNVVLIDFENVQLSSLSELEQEDCYVVLLLGEKLEKVPFEIANAMQRMGTRARYVKIVGNGREAFDFHLAFYIGEYVHQQPNASFHLISKDNGLDPLIQHLRSKEILAKRHSNIQQIPKEKPVFVPHESIPITAHLPAAAPTPIVNPSQPSALPQTPTKIQVLKSLVNWCWVGIIQHLLSQNERYLGQEEIVGRLPGWLRDAPAAVGEVIALLNSYNLYAEQVNPMFSANELWEKLLTTWKMVALVRRPFDKTAHYILLQGVNQERGTVLVADPWTGTSSQQAITSLYLSWEWLSCIAVTSAPE